MDKNAFAEFWAEPPMTNISHEEFCNTLFA